MGRIDLGRERGVSPTDKPLPTTVVNDNTGLAGIHSIEKANDRLAAGMRHISDSMFEISKDMKNSEVRLETVNAQIEYFDRSQAALRELSERNIHDQTEYENAFNAAMDKVDAHMAKWAKDNTSWGESRDALGLMAKDGRAKNFASAMGQFLDARKKRKAQTLQNNYDRLVDSGDISNVEVLLDNSGLAPETKKIYLEKAARKIAENGIADLKNRLVLSTSQEEAEKLISEIRSDPRFASLPDEKKSAFDVFALAEMNRKAKSLAASKRKDTSDKISALNAQLKSATEEFGREFADKAVDADALKKRLEDILDASNFSPDEKTKARAELDTQILECKDRAKSVYKTYNKNRAFETLKSARQNDGFIDAETMKDDGVARARREADLLGGYEKLDEAGKVEYRGRFYSLLSDISRYSAKADEDGTELAALMKRAQTFPKSSRKELMEAIYNTANAIPSNGNWTAESVKQFNAKFDDVCKLGKDSHWYTSDKNPELALDFRTRVLTLAKVRNLSLSETVEEMKKDPFYAETIASANRQKALEFIRK